MSFEVRDLMVKVLPLQAQGCDNQSCNLCETTPPDCTPCGTTGGTACQEPTQCEDCKETAGETCDNTCNQTKAAMERMGEETGPGLGMGLVLLQQQLRQTLDQAL